MPQVYWLLDRDVRFQADFPENWIFLIDSFLSSLYLYIDYLFIYIDYLYTIYFNIHFLYFLYDYIYVYTYVGMYNVYSHSNKYIISIENWFNNNK